MAGGLPMSSTTLIVPSDALCRSWAENGFSTEDIESAALALIVEQFGVVAIAGRATSDLLDTGRTFLDPVNLSVPRALARANTATWVNALESALRAATERGDAL